MIRTTQTISKCKSSQYNYNDAMQHLNGAKKSWIILKMIQTWKIFLLIKSHEIEVFMSRALQKSNFPFWSQTHH